MKFTQSNWIRQKGMTLVEVTLVIAVLLSLIRILFIGVAAYTKGADRAKCILNIATVQKAARSHQNLYALQTGDALAAGGIAGPGKLLENVLACPDSSYSSGSYTYGTTVPASNAAFVGCNLAGSDQHVPASLSGW